jgi:hypothetical protein
MVVSPRYARNVAVRILLSHMNVRLTFVGVLCSALNWGAALASNNKPSKSRSSATHRVVSRHRIEGGGNPSRWIGSSGPANQVRQPSPPPAKPESSTAEWHGRRATRWMCVALVFSAITGLAYGITQQCGTPLLRYGPPAVMWVWATGSAWMMIRHASQHRRLTKYPNGCPSGNCRRP